MRITLLSTLLSISFLVTASPAYADIANPEDTSDNSDGEESEEESDTGKEDDSGCSSVGTEANVAMALFPVAGLGLLALYRRRA